MFVLYTILFVGILGQCFAQTTMSPEDQCMRMCPMVYRPVCDSNGRTHSNKCVFEIAQCIAKVKGETLLTIAFNGPCDACKGVCPDVYEPVCGTNFQTYSNDCELQYDNCKATLNGKAVIKVDYKGECCRMICPFIYFPVCGSDGNTYGNTCNLEVQNCMSKKRGFEEIKFSSQGPCPDQKL